MRTIYKYDLGPDGMVAMPIGSKILAVQTQGNKPFIWAEIVDNAAQEMVKFSIFGTGHSIPHPYDGEYIGTFQLEGGALVFHVYRDKEGGE